MIIYNIPFDIHITLTALYAGGVTFVASRRRRRDSVVETKLADVEQGFRIGNPLSTSSLDLIRECHINWPGNTMNTAEMIMT
jgi:hypothetical protein